MTNAFEYVIQNHGIESEVTYPYVAKVSALPAPQTWTAGIPPMLKTLISTSLLSFQHGQCKYDPKFRAAKCSSYGFLPKGNEAALKEAVANIGPISVAIDASHPKFIFYHHG